MKKKTLKQLNDANLKMISKAKQKQLKGKGGDSDILITDIIGG